MQHPAAAGRASGSGGPAGELRDDVDAEDVLIALRMLAAASPGVGTKDAERYVDVVLRGLRPR